MRFRRVSAVLNMRDGTRPRVIGWAFDDPRCRGLHLFAHRIPNTKLWRVSHWESGLRIGSIFECGYNRDAAVRAALAYLREKSDAQIRAVVGEWA